MYRQSGWLLTIVTLALLLLPSFFLQIIFVLSTGSDQSVLTDILPVILVGVPWLLAFVSLMMMFFAGAYQFKNDMKLKGAVNLVVLITLFFISPPGVN
ncbi:MAG: hypothetical protein U1C49_00605 [Candidatus Andersenbacteria bacterium]|nr:hypothetical protein [bacterium]MDZ4225326.1 hypothetical protein [Candidatus Andersenbacteria bacterium]